MIIIWFVNFKLECYSFKTVGDVTRKNGMDFTSYLLTCFFLVLHYVPDIEELTSKAWEDFFYEQIIFISLPWPLKMVIYWRRN